MPVMRKSSIKPIKKSKMFRLFLIIIILLCLVNVANAKAFYITKDEPAPFSGLLLDEYSYKQATVESMQLEEYKKLHDIDSKIIQKLKKQQDDTMMVKALYFFGGVIVGGLATNAVHGK